jgi:hypothetical protein
MSAIFVESHRDHSHLVHRITVDKAVRGREMLDTRDGAMNDVLNWIEDPANHVRGEFGMLNFQVVDGEGGFYTWGFSDADTAKRFTAAFPVRS